MGSSPSKPDKFIYYVGSEDVKGETRPFKSWYIPPNDPLPDKLPGNIDTMLACFENTHEKNREQPLYGTREKTSAGALGAYRWKSHDAVHHIVTCLAKCFLELGLLAESEYEGRKLKTMGVFCKTREEWIYTWIACWYTTACIVPLYDTLGEESIEWIINQADLKCVVTTTPFVAKVTKLKGEGKLPNLKAVIVIDPITPEEKVDIEKAGLAVYMFDECIHKGQMSKVVLKPEVTPTTVATICYTSGTTSRPKGVMLTHRNYVSLAEGIKRLPFVKPKKGDSCICWLPLAHVFEQFTAVVMLAMGVKLGFYSGDVTKLADDMQALKPQFFGSVPRVLNRIYDQIGSEVAKLTGFKKALYNRAVSVKRNRLQRYGIYTHWLYDKLVFAKIRNKIGGNMGVIFVGGAPLAPEVLEMCRIWLSCCIVQGYGQTETTGPVIAQTPEDVFPASIGGALPHAEAKFVDVPEMRYFMTDTNTEGKPTPRGEIWVRGPAVAAGYWKEPALTAETFEKDGWVRTGDIAMMDPTGHVVIIDRKKQIFKLAQVYIFLAADLMTQKQIGRVHSTREARKHIPTQPVRGADFHYWRQPTNLYCRNNCP